MFLSRHISVFVFLYLRGTQNAEELLVIVLSFFVGRPNFGELAHCELGVYEKVIFG